MDITATIAEMKQDPAFAENVGMVLAHNGTVRGWSRSDHRQVSAIKVVSDQHKVEQIRHQIEHMPGIFRVAVEARSGTLMPGDDLLFMVVAGDIRENVKEALSLLLERIKTEAVSKTEYTPGEDI